MHTVKFSDVSKVKSDLLYAIEIPNWAQICLTTQTSSYKFGKKLTYAQKGLQMSKQSKDKLSIPSSEK